MKIHKNADSVVLWGITPEGRYQGIHFDRAQVIDLIDELHLWLDKIEAKKFEVGDRVYSMVGATTRVGTVVGEEYEGVVWVAFDHDRGGPWNVAVDDLMWVD